MKSTACENAVCEMSCSSPAILSLRPAPSLPNNKYTPKLCSNLVTVLNGNANADGPACLIPFNLWNVAHRMTPSAPGSPTSTSPYTRSVHFINPSRFSSR